MIDPRKTLSFLDLRRLDVHGHVADGERCVQQRVLHLVGDLVAAPHGKPGIHHLESRAFKDAIPRYKTMRGYRVPRRAGWDTHGLPVELEVEKKLGFSSKKDIEAYGIAAFNKTCPAAGISQYS